MWLPKRNLSAFIRLGRPSGRAHPLFDLGRPVRPTGGRRIFARVKKNFRDTCPEKTSVELALPVASAPAPPPALSDQEGGGAPTFPGPRSGGGHWLRCGWPVRQDDVVVCSGAAKAMSMPRGGGWSSLAVQVMAKV